ncbi:uncharacterized protein FIBRA_02415 [Fibroporia radiculosa]|uniref:Xylanolytic transcriptional activator regulatory domain-containing protein n=1 Tax=Fibroporia radiculosa TaxID=599839 RepID=J4GMV4_9APHY|nr:uncharacterized protein FIBRA_02415 [Fibroporia radiculosa]CCM00385.1 predicted protein [Fibroporia radiculosa]
MSSSFNTVLATPPVPLPSHSDLDSLNGTQPVLVKKRKRGATRLSFVLASTQELHEKITLLSSRIRDLEEGLRSSHSAHSVDQHPLLAEDLLLIKAPIQREGVAQIAAANAAAQEDGTDMVDSFGSLAISDTGRTSYFGQATSSWYFLTNESSREEDRDNRRATLRQLLPPEILALSGVFPVAPHIQPTLESESDRLERLRTLFWYLPPADEAAELRQIYYQHASWMYSPMSLETFNEQIFYVFYSSNVPQMDDPLLTHQLGLMFMVLAIGSLMDLARPAYNIEAEKYHQLARAALFQSPIFEEPTLAAVQALYLMAFYLFWCERHGTGVGTRWALMGLAVKLSVSMGLHRDAGRWNVEPIEIQRRRETFWEVYSYDLLQSFTLGRPPSFSLAHVDCKKPRLEDPNGEGTFHWWKHKFTSECMNSVYDQAFGAKTATYSTVLQLDRKLRSFPVPQLLQIAGFGSTEPRTTNYQDSVPLILQRHTVLAIRESNLLYMHRGFFARAVSDHPQDPLGSPYGSSFIAAYRSAGSLVALVRNIHSQLKELTERMWFLWTHLFSCSIILGSIVTRCPSMSLAHSALLQLDSACDLFAKTAKFFHAEKVLNIMMNLRDRAHASLAAYRNSPPQRNGSVSEPTTPADAPDELNILGGRTRLVASKEKSMSPQIMDRSPTSLNPIVPLPLKDTDWQQDSVMQYLRSFAPTPAPMGYNGPHVPQMPQAPVNHSAIHQRSPSFEHEALQGMAPINTSFGQMAEGYPSTSGGLSSGMLQMEGMIPTFPQYFPVFDYGMPSTDIFVSSPQSLDGGDPRSYSPDSATMQSTWQDFVAQMGGSVPV